MRDADAPPSSAPLTSLSQQSSNGTADMSTASALASALQRALRGASAPSVSAAPALDASHGIPDASDGISIGARPSGDDYPTAASAATSAPSSPPSVAMPEVSPPPAVVGAPIHLDAPDGTHSALGGADVGACPRGDSCAVAASAAASSPASRPPAPAPVQSPPPPVVSAPGHPDASDGIHHQPGAGASAPDRAAAAAAVPPPR